jgi:cytochrome c oxidase cbb3-type subunit 3
VISAFILTGCEREARRFRDNPVAPKTSAVSLSELHAGSVAPTRDRGPYDDEAWSVSEGQRNFSWFNCNGCHANGGGGMGPPLMDDTWIYGHEPANIFASIVEGRPNGMPSFQNRLTEQQVWQLVAYVRSLSGQLRKDVEPGRRDSMSSRLTPQSTPPERPVNSE